MTKVVYQVSQKLYHLSDTDMKDTHRPLLKDRGGGREGDKFLENR
jgi:hypothetical protein